MLRSTTLVLALAPLLLAGCGGAESSRGDGARGVPPCTELRLPRIPNGASVVLIVNDTMRRDRVGAYGGPAATPNFDRFAREHLLFTEAIAPAPWTKPSVASLFTSLYPSQHGVASDPRARAGTKFAVTLPVDILAEDFVTMAEILRQSGLRTAAFVGNPWLQERHGFAQGFETYVDQFGGWKASGADIVQAALDWLATLAPGESFFLYVHTIDSHRPYGRLTPDEAERLPPPAPEDAALLGEDGTHLVHSVLKRTDGEPLVPPDQPASRAAVARAYDSGLADFDRALGTLLDGLRAHEAWERTAVFVTSDHGEALFTRGYGNHGGGLFDDELAIPLAARLPGTEPSTGQLACPVSLVDLVPSLCAYLGLEPPPSTAGWSFLAAPSPAPRAERRYLVSEGTMVDPRHRAIRDRNYKLVFEPSPRRAGGPSARHYALFDLVRDPGELSDLLGGSPSSDVDELFQELLAALPQSVPAFTAPTKAFAPLDEEQLEGLRALGYVDDE